MRTRGMTWGGCGVALWLGAAACSGTRLNEVGEVNTASAGSGGSLRNTGGAASTLGGAAGSVGNTAGTAGRVDPDVGGEGGGPDNDTLDCPTCVVVAASQDVRGVAANDEKVLWVDYGTSDDLGNYNGNGRLLSRNLAGGETTVLADSLPGPESVSLSDQYAYLFVDRQGGLDHSLGVVRVPLAGGVAQPVQSLDAADWSTYRVFAFASGYEYWNWGGAVYRVAEAGDAPVETFVAARGVLRILTDDTLVYYQDATGIWTVPVTGGDATKLSSAGDSASVDIALLNGSYLYAQETSKTASVSDSYLTRMPRVGGTWTRIAVSPNYLTWSQLAVDGDEYFIDEPTKTQRQIQQGSLMTPATRTTLAAERAPSAFWKAWTLSSVGVFLADSSGLYLTPVVAP
jgi:hypothetical protein